MRECTGTILRDSGKHTITHAEPVDLATNGNDYTRQFIAEDKRKLWPLDCAKLPFSELKVYRVQTRSAYFNENITCARRGCRDILQPRALRAAVMLENVCAHDPLPTSPSRLMGPHANVKGRLNVNGSPAAMRIGELARRSGPSRIRFYEAKGLINVVSRKANGYREYPADALIILDIIVGA